MVNIKNLYLPFILISHPVFLVVFFILLRYNDNQDELLFSDLIYVFSIILSVITFIVLSLTIILKISKKNLTKPILASSYSVVLFFIYVPLHNALYEFQINSFTIGRHSILLPIVIIFAVTTIYFFLKSKYDYKKLLLISYAMVLILIFFNISEILFYSDIYSHSENTNLIQDFLITENPRDVYYILLDEHSGTKALETYLNYDNSNFDKSLKDMGFFIPNTSFSNYTPTRMSIPAILNMNYVDIEKDLSLKEYEIILERMIGDNTVTKIFEKNNYDVIYFYNELNMQINTNSGIELCNNSIGNHQFFSFILDNTPIVVFKNTLDKGNNKEHAENRLCVLESIPHLDDITSKPKFVFAHVLSPHAPYVFESDGTVPPYRNVGLEQQTKAYLDQLEFIDSKVLETVKLLLEKDPKPIIVIQSDHGYRTTPIEDNFESLDQSFSNISAFYFPNIELTDDSIHTTVNTFRILFNENFGTDYELLENRIYRTYDHTQKDDYYQTSDITNTLIP